MPVVFEPSYSGQCDGCRRRPMIRRSTRTALLDELATAGWSRRGAEIYCPSCTAKAVPASEPRPAWRPTYDPEEIERRILELLSRGEIQRNDLRIAINPNLSGTLFNAAIDSLTARKLIRSTVVTRSKDDYRGVPHRFKATVYRLTAAGRKHAQAAGARAR